MPIICGTKASFSCIRGQWYPSCPDDFLAVVDIMDEGVHGADPLLDGPGKPSPLSR